MEALATHMMKKKKWKKLICLIYLSFDIRVHARKIMACKLAMDMFHYKKEDLHDGIDDLLPQVTFIKRVQVKGVHMLFI